MLKLNGIFFVAGFFIGVATIAMVFAVVYYKLHVKIVRKCDTQDQNQTIRHLHTTLDQAYKKYIIELANVTITTNAMNEKLIELEKNLDIDEEDLIQLANLNLVQEEIVYKFENRMDYVNKVVDSLRGECQDLKEKVKNLEEARDNNIYYLMAKGQYGYNRGMMSL